MFPALLLAAGSSTRLRPFTDHLPKSLLPVAGVSMLERSLRHLRTVGVREIVVVTGFEAAKLEAAVRSYAPDLEVAFVHNADYATTNNAYSLMLAGPRLAGREFLLLDSDLMYDGGILERIVAADTSCLALRPADDLGLEEVKVAMAAGGRVHGIGKEVAIADAVGESVGIQRFRAADSTHLFATLERRMRGLGLVGEYYEASFQAMIDEGCALQAIDIRPHRAMEIDTPEDLAAAERVFAATDATLLPAATAPRAVRLPTA